MPKYGTVSQVLLQLVVAQLCKCRKSSHVLRRKHSRSTGNISRTAIYNSTDDNCYCLEEYILDRTSVFILVLLLNGAVEESMFRRENYSEFDYETVIRFGFRIN